MQFYVADYLADTMHLDAEEHGAYLLLIFNYWQTAKPIPKERLQKIARVSNDRWPSVELSLKGYFNDTGTEWVHKRIEADLAIIEEAQAQKVAAGKASAAAKKRANAAKKKREANDRSTTVATPVADPLKRESSGCSDNKESDSDIDSDKEITPNGDAAASVEPEDPPIEPEQEQNPEPVEPTQTKPPTIWDVGVPLLISQGMKEPSARAFIGKLSKEFTDVEVGKALATASMRNPVPADLRSWLPRALQHQRDGPKNKPSAALHTFDHVDYAFGVAADGSF